MICDDTRVRFDIRRLWLAGMTGLRVDGVLIRITTTPCTYGGERRWFLCPGCSRRCAVLYEGLRCRICLKGQYRSSRLSPAERMIRKASKLRRKLGQGHPVSSNPIPPRPARMRWHTYQRLHTEIRALELEAARLMNTRLMTGRRRRRTA